MNWSNNFLRFFVLLFLSNDFTLQQILLSMAFTPFGPLSSRLPKIHCNVSEF